MSPLLWVKNPKAIWIGASDSKPLIRFQSNGLIGRFDKGWKELEIYF